MIEIRVNSNEIERSIGKLTKKLEKAMPNILRKSAMSTRKELRKHASRFAFEGDLMEGIVLGKTSSRRATVKITGTAATEAMLAEFGPTGSLIGYKRTVYLGSSNDQKLKRWAQSRLGRTKGRLRLGGSAGGRTSWGKPSHRFMSAERRTRPIRVKQIIKKELSKVK